MLRKLIALSCILVCGLAHADVRSYEDAEDGSASRWRVVDDTPAGASVSVVSDPSLGSQVIQLSGNGTDNAYRIGGSTAAGGGWNDTSRFFLSWKMRSAENFAVYVAVSTSSGFRYLTYDTRADDRGLFGGYYVHHGLGPASRDDTWRTVERDLVADLADVEPDNTLLAVHGFFTRGSFRLDDLSLSDLPPPPAQQFVYEDAEDGSAGRWRVVDDTPAGASVSVVSDPSLGSQVIQLSGNGTDNAYRIGGSTAAGGGWNDTSRFFLSWKMRSAENFAVYVAVSTSSGFRYLTYDTRADDRGLFGGYYVHHGLGPASRDDTWRTVERDLVADLADVEPDNTLLAVHGFFTRGSFRLDDLSLSPASTSMNRSPTADAGRDVSVELGQTITLDGSASRDPDGAIVSYSWRRTDDTVVGTTASIAYTPAVVGTESISLTVVDDGGSTGTDTTVVTTTAGSGVAKVNYEDAEDGSAGRWRVVDDTPAGASVSVVSDPSLGSQVIQLSGNGTDNAYRIGGSTAAGGGWNDTSRFFLSWKMRSAENFAVYVAVSTSSGFRYLTYDTRADDRGLFGGYYVHHGLGPASRDDTWRTVERDLVADLADVEPDNTLLAVHGFFTRGSFRLDDLSLSTGTDGTGIGLPPPPPMF